MTLCKSCKEKEEDMDHMLFKCPAARAFWVGAQVGYLSDEDILNLQDKMEWWFLSPFAKVGGDLRLAIQCIAISLEHMKGEVQSLLWKCYLLPSAGHLQSREGRGGLVLLLYASTGEPCLYCVMEATFSGLCKNQRWWCFSDCSGAAGLVVKNDRGIPIFAQASYFPCSSAEGAEAKAFLLGLHVAANLGFVFEVEGDALSVVNAIRSLSSVPWRIGATIADCKTAFYLSRSSISFVPRLANSLANALASSALKCRLNVSWSTSFLTDCIVNLALADYINV